MFSNSHDDKSSQSSAIYVNKKGINELFEAMITALMIHKPDDHISFLRGCLDKVKTNHNHIPWDSFVVKSTPFSIHQKHKKLLPPIISSVPIIFILSSSGGIQLSSRLLERYDQIDYLLIDDDEPIDLLRHEHRYDSIRNAIEERRSQVNGFLIAGGLDEYEFLERWQAKLGRIDLIVILYLNPTQRITNRNFNTLQIDLTNDFEDILTLAIHHFDRIFPRHVSLNQYSSTMRIIFCINNEFEMIDEKQKNNSLLSTLCHRLAKQFSFKLIHYKNFSKLKNEINTSRNFYAGYIIDHFPNSIDDVNRFHSEIGICSVLIYADGHQRSIQSDEINEIIEEFQMKNRALGVDCRMELDEIYDDLKTEILNHL